MSDINLVEVAKKYNVIIVEGYDGVGKSTFMKGLADSIGGTIYRPDYIYWQSVGLPKGSRWIIGASFFDFMKSRSIQLTRPLLIDRGILSAMVYNSPRLGKNYKTLIDESGLSVLHLIVNTDEESYKKYCSMRGSEGIPPTYRIVAEKTKLFIDYASLLGIDYLTVNNQYSEDYARLVGGKCGSCGHYSYGVCQHPIHRGRKVSPDTPRCEESAQKEVQDQ